MVLVFIFTIIFLLLLVLIFSDNNYDFRTEIMIDKTNIMKKIIRYITPRDGSKLRTFYEKRLLFTNMKIEMYFAIKLVFVAIVILLTIAIKFTNINIIEKRFFEFNQTLLDRTASEFNVDVEIQKKIFNKAKQAISKDYVKSKEVSLDIIHNILVDMKIGRDVNYYSLKTSTYQLLVKYYESKRNNYYIYFGIFVSSYFIVDIMLIAYVMVIDKNKNTELKKLKTLILVSGSLHNHNFNNIINTLIHNSYYYKSILKKINDFNRVNVSDLNVEYEKIINSLPELEEVFLIENIQAVNNGYCEDVIDQIKNQSAVDDVEGQQKYQSKLENIEMVGILCSMSLMLACFMYMMSYWLDNIGLSHINIY